jgi:hypothetical protein
MAILMYCNIASHAYDKPAIMLFDKQTCLLHIHTIAHQESPPVQMLKTKGVRSAETLPGAATFATCDATDLFLGGS